MTQNNQEIARLRQRLAQNSIVVEFTRRFAATLEADEIETMLIEAVFQVTGAPQIALHLLHGQQVRSQVYDPLAGFRCEEKELPPNAAAHQLFHTPAPLFWNRANHSAETPPITILPGENLENYLALPLKSAHAILGVIEAFNAAEPDNAQQQADLLREIAGPASLALANGMLYQSAQHEITAREQANALLQESLERYRILGEFSPDPIVTYDTKGNVTSVNHAFTRVFGWTEAELVGHRLNFVPEEENAGTQARIQDLYQEGQAIDRTYRYTKDGRRLPVEINAGLVRDIHGQPTGSVVIIRDETKQLEAENIIHASQAQLTEALRIADLANWEYDVATDTFTFNDQFYALLRTSVDQIGGYTMTSGEYATRFVHPDDAPLVGQEIGKALTTTDPDFEGRVEHRILYADGEMGYFSVGFRILKDAEGRTIKTYGANQDITIRKRAEEVVQTSQTQLTEALRIAKLANWEYDVPTDTFTFNDQFYALLRTNIEQMGGYSMSSAAYATRFVYPDDAPMVGQEIGEALTTTDPHFSRHLEHRIIYADGEIGYFSVDFRIQKDAEGRTIKTFGANQDITERKKSEIAYARQARELEAVAQISAAAATIQETSHLLQTVVDLTKGSFNLYHAHIYLLNEANNLLELTSGSGNVGRQMVKEGRSIPLDREQSLVARAARTRQAVIVNDVHEDPGFLPNPLLPHTRTEMAVPLQVGGRVLGVLDIQGDTPNQFTPQEANIMSTLASQVSIAIQNTRSFERYEQTLAELNLVTRRLTREAWDDYLNISQEDLEFTYGVQPTPAESNNGSNGYGLTRSIAIQGEVIGKLDLLEPEVDTDEADEIIAAVAERLSTHLENLRLTEQTQYALSQTESLYLGSSRVARASSIQEVMDALVQSTALVRMDRANIILFNQAWAHEMPDTGTVIAVWEKDGQPPRAPVGTVYQARLFPSIQLFSASQPTLFYDVATDERVDANLRALMIERLGMRCFLIFPFVVSGQWWGFISAQASRSIYLTDEEVRQVSSLTDQAATVVQTLRLFEQANVRAEQLAILNEMARDLTIALDVDSALETVHHYTDLLMEARNFYIAFYDNEAQSFTFPIVIEDSKKTTWEPQPFANGLNEYVIHSGQGLLIPNNLEAWAEANGVTVTDPVAKSWLGAPLKLANTILGVVVLYSPYPYAFDQNSFDLMSSVANQGSIAIQNARLFEQTQNALAETETLYRATGDINASRRYYEIINVLRSYTLGQQPVKNVTLNLFDRPWNRGQIFPWVEVTERLHEVSDMPVGSRYNLAEFPSAALILSQEEPIFIQDVVTDPRIDAHTREIYHDRLDVRSIIFIPLVAGGQWLGFIDVFYDQGVVFEEVELRRMLALTGQAAVATQNLRNLELAQQRAQEAQSRREESELLYNLSAQLTAANTLDDVLRIVTSPASDAGARSGVLALFPADATDEPTTMEIVAGWSAKNKYLLAPDTLWEVKEHAHLQFLLRYPRSPLYVHDASNDIQVPSAAARKFLARHGTKALVCLPLNIGRRRLGMILLEWETPRVFTNVEQRLYHSVAGQAAVVVDNRQLLVATQTRAAQLDKLSRIETALSIADTDEEILLGVLPSCNGPYSVSLLYVETDRYDNPQAIVVKQMWQAGEFVPHNPLLGESTSLPPGSHIWVENPNELLLIEDTNLDERFDEATKQQFQESGSRALAILPLRSSGRWQGLIHFSWDKPYHFTADERFIWRRLLDALGAVLASRRALLAQQAAREETERLYNASRHLNETAELNEMLGALATVIPNPVLNRAVLMIFEYDEHNELMAMTLRGRWYAGFGTEPSPQGTRYPRAMFDNLSVLLSEEPLFFNDAQNDPRAHPATVAVLKLLNIKAMAILPLWIGSRQIGCVMLQAEQSYSFRSPEMEPYIALAGQLAIAVENQRLFEQTRQQLSDLTAIQQTTSLLTATLTQSDAIKAFLPQVAKAVGAEVVNLYTLLDDKRILRAGQYASIPAPEFPEHEVLYLTDYPTTNEAINTRQPIIRLAGDPRLALRSQQNLSGRTANATIPLIGQNTVMGVLSVNSYQDGYTFTPQAIRLLQTLAEQATVVLERVRLLEETTKRARREQILREVTAKVRGASDVETVMRTAVHEVGRVLGRRTFVQLQKPDLSD